jgi:nicotinamidase-related amidase
MNNCHSAALLLDLQRDFLATGHARMPVGQEEARRVLAGANAVLDGVALKGALPILVVNQFPRSDRLGNFFRHGAAIAGTTGSELDERVHVSQSVKVFAKDQPSAFSNKELVAYLKENSISQVFVLGVFAEGCVRATAVDAVKHGLKAIVPTCAIGTNSGTKRRFAHWAMSRAGVILVNELAESAA